MHKNKETYKIAIIGGSGIDKFEDCEMVGEISIDTPFGKTSDKIKILSFEGREVLFLERHSKGHVLLPSEIPQKANIWALKSLGVKFIIAISAVGSLRENIKPGELVLPDQIIDNTKNRNDSFFGKSLVGHISYAEPFSQYLSDIIYKVAKKNKIKIHRTKTYICMEGPAFSSRAESKMYRKWGADVVGMTAIPEARLAREAEIAYSTISMSTDYDSWRDRDRGVELSDILNNMKHNVENINKILPQIISAIDTKKITPEHDATKYSILSDLKLVKEKTKSDVKVIFRHFD